jgi:hypothetical protein
MSSGRFFEKDLDVIVHPLRNLGIVLFCGGKVTFQGRLCVCSSLDRGHQECGGGKSTMRIRPNRVRRSWCGPLLGCLGQQSLHCDGCQGIRSGGIALIQKVQGYRI